MVIVFFFAVLWCYAFVISLFLSLVVGMRGVSCLFAVKHAVLFIPCCFLSSHCLSELTFIFFIDQLVVFNVVLVFSFDRQLAAWHACFHCVCLCAASAHVRLISVLLHPPPPPLTATRSCVCMCRSLTVCTRRPSSVNGSMPSTWRSFCCRGWRCQSGSAPRVRPVAI